MLPYWLGCAGWQVCYEALIGEHRSDTLQVRDVILLACAAGLRGMSGYLTSPTRMKRGEYGAARECKGGRKRMFPAKNPQRSVIVWHDPHVRKSGERTHREANLPRLGGRRVVQPLNHRGSRLSTICIIPPMLKAVHDKTNPKNFDKKTLWPRFSQSTSSSTAAIRGKEQKEVQQFKSSMEQSLLASQQGKPGSIPDRATPGLWHVGIVPDDAAGLRVFSTISCFTPPFRSCAAPYSRQSLTLTLKTSLLTAAPISSLTHHLVALTASSSSHVTDAGNSSRYHEFQPHALGKQHNALLKWRERVIRQSVPKDEPFLVEPSWSHPQHGASHSRMKHFPIREIGHAISPPVYITTACFLPTIRNCFGQELCPVAPSWFETRFEIGSKIDTDNCCTIRVQSWTGDWYEVHSEPSKLAVLNLDPRSAAIVDKCRSRRASDEGGRSLHERADVITALAECSRFQLCLSSSLHTFHHLPPPPPAAQLFPLPPRRPQLDRASRLDCGLDASPRICDLPSPRSSLSLRISLPPLTPTWSSDVDIGKNIDIIYTATSRFRGSRVERCSTDRDVSAHGHDMARDTGAWRGSSICDLMCDVSAKGPINVSRLSLLKMPYGFSPLSGKLFSLEALICYNPFMEKKEGPSTRIYSYESHDPGDAHICAPQIKGVLAVPASLGKGGRWRRGRGNGKQGRVRLEKCDGNKPTARPTTTGKHLNSCRRYDRGRGEVAAWLKEFCSSEAYKRGSARGDRCMRTNTLIASTRKALNWRAVSPSITHFYEIFSGAAVQENENGFRLAVQVSRGLFRRDPPCEGVFSLTRPFGIRQHRHSSYVMHVQAVDTCQKTCDNLATLQVTQLVVVRADYMLALLGNWQLAINYGCSRRRNDAFDAGVLISGLAARVYVYTGLMSDWPLRAAKGSLLVEPPAGKCVTRR
ncbi:hypothetical protein PR048_006841 [Dryococelus australis]|uniref:Uncharacterized protein n=1 Tax=Dryococelus australis TaxID=614101 RepID=A0ABQ9IC17_9NEOP|nr:hypothetical protein PR048_006841 [Dryococelus australis]